MENNEINCKKIVEEYLLNKNPLYTFSFPLALLIAIIIFGISKARNWSENSYINQILIPILGFLATMVLIDIISRMMISSDEKNYLIKKCKIWMRDPAVSNDPVLSKIIDMNLVINYNENRSIENFSNSEFENSEENMQLESFNIDQELEEFTIQNNNIDNITKYDENLNDIMKVNEIVFQEQKKNYKENPEAQISEIPNISPYPVKLEYPVDYERCVGGNTHGMTLCSGPDTQENPMHYPVPGPQWLPQSAETVQIRLSNNDYW